MATDIPKWHQLMWPAIEAVKALGGSATNREMYERVVADQAFSEAQQGVVAPNGRQSQIEYRLNWARSHLKAVGVFDNSARGVWSITDKGRVVSKAVVFAEVDEWRASMIKTRRSRRRQADVDADSDDQPAIEEDDSTEGGTSVTEGAEDESNTAWKDRLLERLMELPSDGFERLAQRLLREAGFVNVAVTGRSGDGGIDGVGTYRISLVSFPVFFQCKRYRGSVGAGAVRDFRGAMAGRGEKGLLLTTGIFTRDAQNEARRDGAPPVELVDGDALCDLLREYRLGVRSVERIEIDVEVVREFFDEFMISQ